MSDFIQAIIDFFRGKKKSSSGSSAWGKGVDPARAGANAGRAIERVRKATHPALKDRTGRSQHVIAGERKIGDLWCLWSAASGGWIGGYYIPEKRACYTIANPANLNDYSDAIMEHESAHDVEYVLLRIAPPWHYAAWKKLFRNWYNVPAARVISTDAPPPPEKSVFDLLPGVEPGDHVEIDFVDGGALYLASATGLDLIRETPYLDA